MQHRTYKNDSLSNGGAIAFPYESGMTEAYDAYLRHILCAQQ